MDIFSVLSQHVDWLSQRHSVAANNVANLDTPGYRAKQVEQFNLALDQTGTVNLLRTSPSHLSDAAAGTGQFEVSYQNNNDVSLSGNDVTIEKEMASIGETSRMFNFDTALERMFQRMFVSSIKG